jgi:hypothetical protein
MSGAETEDGWPETIRDSAPCRLPLVPPI